MKYITFGAHDGEELIGLGQCSFPLNLNWTSSEIVKVKKNVLVERNLILITLFLLYLKEGDFGKLFIVLARC